MSSSDESADRSPTDEAGAVLLPVPQLAEAKLEPRSFLETARRKLSEEELAAPAVRRFLISDIERLDEQCSKLQPFVEMYHNLRVEKAEVDAKLRASRLTDVLSAVCVAAGSAAIGASSKFIELHVATASVLLVAGALLVIAGIAAKVVK